MDTHQLHRVGYARVNSIGQNLDSHIDALKAAGCKKIFTDQITGSRMDRPGWDQLIEYVRPSDVPVVAFEPQDGPPRRPEGRQGGSSHVRMSSSCEMPKCSTTTPARRRTRSARSLALADASSSPTWLNREIRLQ
jgi:hypothetical protein